MGMSEKCRNNNNSDNPWTSSHTDGGKNGLLVPPVLYWKKIVKP